MNGYKLSVEDASRVVDVFSKLDMSAATSSKELAIAFSRTANSASDMGVSFEELAGWITTVSETTRRSASTVGESFKTVFARMANIKLGIAVDPESGEAINDVEKALSTLDIHLRKSPTEWRSAQDVLTEIGNNWDTYNDKQKNTIVTAIAGVRQAEVLRAAFNNFDKVLGYTADAYDSAGSSAEKYGTYLDSIEVKQNKLTTALTDIAYQPQWEELYKTILDVATVFTTFVGKTVTSIPALAAFGAALIGIVSPSITKGINNLVGGLNEMANQVNQFGGEKGDAFGGAKRTASVNRLANSIENVVNASDSYSDVQKKVLVANKRTIASEFLNIDAQNKSKLAKEKSKAATLRLILAKDADAKTTSQQQVANLKLATSQTVANASTNLLTISISRLAAATKLMAVSLLMNPLTWVFAAASGVMFLKQKYDEWNVTIEEQKEIVDNLAGSVEGLRSEYEQLSSKAWRTSEEERQLKLLERELQAEERLYEIEKKRLAQKIINEWTDDGVPDQYDSFDVGQTKIQQQTVELNKYKTAKQKIIDLENKKINGTISDTELTTLESLQKQAEESETALLELYQSLVPLIDTGEVMPEALSKFINDLEISLGLVGDYSAKIEDLKNQNKFLAEVTDKVTKSQSLSKDEVEKLKQLYPELEDDIKETTNGWTIEKKALDEVSGAVSALESAYTTANNMMTEVLQSGTAIRFGILASELEAIQSVYDAINLTQTKTGATKQDILKFYGEDSEQYKLLNQLEILGQAKAKIKELEEDAKRRADGDGFTPTDKSKDKKDKEVDVLKAYKARKKILESEIEFSKAKQREYKKDSAEYVKEQKYQHDKYVQLKELAHQEAERLRKLDSKLYDDESSQIATLKDDWAKATDSMASYKQYMFDLVQSFKDNYGKSLLDNVQKKIDAIENKKLNDSNIENLKNQIEAEKEKLKLIEKQSDEESKKTEEIRKQKELIKSLQGQKDIRVYRAETGWTWEQDRQKIVEEQEKLTEMETELQKAQIQAVIDSLEEKLADAEKAYDDQIAQLRKELKNAQYLLGLKEDEGDQLVLMLKQMNAFGDANKEAVNSVLDFADALSKSMGFGGIDRRQMLIDAGYTTAQIDKLLGPETSSQPTYTKTNKGTYISSSSSGAYDSSGNYTVGTSGNAPSDTKVGTIVNTAGGAVKVVEKGTPGANYNPASGLYSVRVNDDGGLNTGKGMMLKNVIEPERVLSPEQTKSFEKLVNYLPIIKPVIDTYSFSGKPQGSAISSTDNSVTIQNLNIQAPNGATLQSLLLEAKNIAKINKR